MSDLKTIAEYTNKKIPACKFVGLSTDGELFVEFSHNDSEAMKEAKAQLKAAFPELNDVVAVIKPSITHLTQMVNDLNALLEETESVPETKAPLLGIEEF